MRYRVAGARRGTGEAAELVIEASSASSAERKANQRGLLVESCTPFPTATPIPPTSGAAPKPTDDRSIPLASTEECSTRTPPEAGTPANGAAAPPPASPNSTAAPPVAPISRQMRETAWVAAGFGWFFFAFSVVFAGISVAMAADGEFVHAQVDDRPVMMLTTFVANAVAIGLIAIGKPARLAAIFGNSVRAVRPPSLRTRFQMMGKLRGRTRAEIVAAVGRPVAVSAMPGGALLQWGEDRYHVALTFSGTGDDAVCRGVASEISV